MEQKIEVINLTPHSIKVILPNGEEHIFFPSGTVARVTSTPVHIGSINDIPVVATVFEDVKDLPEPKDNTVYIVSMLLLQAVGHRRKDLVAPDTNPDSVIRDRDGQIIGVRRFQTYLPK